MGPGTGVKALIAVVALVGTVASGCAHIELTSVMSTGVERIPARLAIHPLLSSPLSPSRSKLRPMDFWGMRRDSSQVVITPPVGTRLEITEESQILTSLLSVELAARGFRLTELPLELMAGSDSSLDMCGEPHVALSLELLNELRSRCDVPALLIGTAFFVRIRLPGTGIFKREVVAAHLRIVDIESLDVLAQVSLPYNYGGRNLNETARSMGLELTRLAHLSPAEQAASRQEHAPFALTEMAGDR